MANEQQLKLDLEELKHLESIAKRPRVISLLSSEIRNLDSKALEVSNALKYVTLDKFNWDQDINDNIMIYVFLEGVEEEKIEANFKPMSVDVKFHDVQGKSYRCAIPKLNKEIVPEKCKVVVKPSKVLITLFKASKGDWLDLRFKEDKLKPSMDKDKDPMGGIMDLMKNGTDQVEMLNLFREMLQAQQQQTAELIHTQQQQIAILAVCTFRDMRPETFSGTEGPLEADDWISTMEEMLRVAGVASELQVDVVRIQLKGLAKDWWKAEEVRLPKPIEWDVFRARFFAKFFPKMVMQVLEWKFTHLRQGNRTVGEYAVEFSRLSKFVPNLVAMKEYYIWQFQMGLNDDVQVSIASREFQTYDEVLNAALQYEFVSMTRRDSGAGIKRLAGTVQYQRSIQTGPSKRINQGT